MNEITNVSQWIILLAHMTKLENKILHRIVHAMTKLNGLLIFTNKKIRIVNAQLKFLLKEQ